MAQLVTGRRSTAGWRTRADEKQVIPMAKGRTGMTGGSIDPSLAIEGRRVKRPSKAERATMRKQAKRRRRWAS